MKKSIVLFIFQITVLTFFVYSCKKDKNEVVTKGHVEFTFSPANLTQSDAKLQTGTTTASSITSAVITITDSTGNAVINALTISLSNINGSFISNQIALMTG